MCIIDIADNPYFVGDIGDEAARRRFAEKVITEYGRVDCLINNAPPLFKGINECTYEAGASVINISSSRDRMSQPQSESYTAAKGGISALTHALAVSLSGKVRVNSISPGWIDNDYTVYEGADTIQTLIAFGSMIFAAIVTSIFVMVLSELLHSNIATLAVSTGLLIMAMIVVVPEQYRLLTQAWDWLSWCFLTPWNVLGKYTLSIFGHYFTSWQVVPIIYLVASAGEAAGNLVPALLSGGQ